MHTRQWRKCPSSLLRNDASSSRETINSRSAVTWTLGGLFIIIRFSKGSRIGSILDLKYARRNQSLSDAAVGLARPNSFATKHRNAISCSR